jgi:hypothetical protein
VVPDFLDRYARAQSPQLARLAALALSPRLRLALLLEVIGR